MKTYQVKLLKDAQQTWVLVEASNMVEAMQTVENMTGGIARDAKPATKESLKKGLRVLTVPEEPTEPKGLESDYRAVYEYDSWLCNYVVAVSATSPIRGYQLKVEGNGYMLYLEGEAQLSESISPYTLRTRWLRRCFATLDYSAKSLRIEAWERLKIQATPQ